MLAEIICIGMRFYWSSCQYECDIPVTRIEKIGIEVLQVRSISDNIEKIKNS